MYLGINLSHGSSACLVDSRGNLLAAIEEERLSRKKNHYGVPVRSINYLLQRMPSDFDVCEVVHGSFQDLNEDSLIRILANLDGSPSNPTGSWNLPRPGWKRPAGDPHFIVEKIINTELHKFGCNTPSHTWIKHHDAHLGTALASSIRARKDESLLITLDGEGDGESGTIAISSSGSTYKRLGSFSNLDSLGYLYQAVTEKYNFKGNQHEGKITGLAAFGSSSAAVELIAKYIQIQNGILTINYTKNASRNRLTRSLRQLGINSKAALSLQEIIDIASSKTNNYEDLAYAVQKVLEDSVLEISKYWLQKTDSKNLAVSGGVFANVKLNQRISDIEGLDFFDIFPNMGDGGLSAGGVWSHLSNTNKLTTDNPYHNMFLAPQQDKVEDYFNHENLEFKSLDVETLAGISAKLIASGKFLGIHYGSMEFGPRALGHRSLLLDPRDRGILKSANERLRRTEFMPFAPVVLESHFERYFDGDLLTRPGFEYMTITCDVKPEHMNQIPAVTHIDGTARPQVIRTNSNDLYACILSEFQKLTGVGVLVNTSLNVHESPINFNLKDSIECLLNGAIDYIATDGYLIFKKCQTIEE